MSFKFFDPDAELAISHGRLPHWEQAGATYFITFRTVDSIPRSVFNQWKQERAAWLTERGVDLADDDWQSKLELLPEASRREFSRRFSQKWHDELDRCHGECLFRQPGLAKIVAESFRHFDGVRYEMGDFVVMPNHVHLLVGIAGREALRRECRSWKKFSAGEINRCSGREGEFWQTESFDHLVRSEGSFDQFRRYIADNPKKVGLREGEFLYYRSVKPLRQSSRVTP
ncbi:MAG: transposase [Verrucomicrobiia bacterium]